MKSLRIDRRGVTVHLARARAAFSWVAFASLALCAAMFSPARTVAAEDFGVTVQRNVAAKMRDGVTLRADIYRPKAEGKFPVLLVRTPYDKTGSMGFGLRAAGMW